MNWDILTQGLARETQKSEERMMSPQDRLWYEYVARQNKREGPFKSQEGEEGETESEESGGWEPGNTVGSWRRKKTEKKEKKKDKDPSKTEALIWKRAKEIAEIEAGKDNPITFELIKSYIPQARSMVAPTEEDRTGLYTEENPNPEMRGITSIMPDAGFEGAPMPVMPGQPPMPGQAPQMGAGGQPPMPNMMPTQEQTMQPQQQPQYTIDQIIDTPKGKVKIIGFDTDGEPLIEKVK